MPSRFDPKAAALRAATVLLPFACSPSGGDAGTASGGSGTGSPSASGGSGVVSGGSSDRAGTASVGTGGASSSSGGTPNGSGGQLGSGGSFTGSFGAVSGGGSSGSAVQAGAAGGDPGGGTKGSGASGSPAGGAGRAESGGSPPGGGGGSVSAPGAAGGGGAAGATGCDEAQGYHLTAKGDSCTNEPRNLCIFDYDLVLSSHSCEQTTSMPTEYLCRTNACTTSSWRDQCLATGARAAIAECVRHGAYIGIASHSNFDECFNDKVIETLTPAAFPELFSSIHYDKSGTDFSYPAIDERANWNCDTCAYHFDGAIGESKIKLIGKVMAHYGLSPTSAADRSRVLYWDDDPKHREDVGTNLPNVTTGAVTSTDPARAGAGCGIQVADISAAWAALAAKSP